MNFQKLAVMVIASVFVTTASAGDSRLMASSGDETIHGLMAKWADLDGKELIWDAGFELPISSPEGLNERLKLDGATTPSEALERLLSTMKDPDFQFLPAIRACVFENAWVVLPAARPCTSVATQ